jgi:hypothetical protein
MKYILDMYNAIDTIYYAMPVKFVLTENKEK